MSKRDRPDISVPNDTGQAQVIRQEAVVLRRRAERARAKHETQKEGLRILGFGLIDRLEKNHFIDMAYEIRGGKNSEP